MNSPARTLESYSNLILAALLLVGLYWTSQYSYNLFHSLAELFSVVVAGAVFVLAWNARRFFKNGYLLFIGIALLFIGALDLVHTLAYKGMGVFVGYDTDLPTQLWIGARYMQALSFLIAPLFLRRKLYPWAVIAAYTLITALMLASIFVWDIFPVAYVEGVGLTPFKRTSEYVISAIQLAAAGLLLLETHDREVLDRQVVQKLAAAMLFGVAAELAFSDYANVYGLANLGGHYLKIISFYFIYKAIIQTGLVQPYNLLFRDLKRHEEALQQAHDGLEARVQRRTLELTQANLELRQAIEERQRVEAELIRYQEGLEELVQARTADLQREVAERRRAEAALERYAAALARSNHDLQDFAYVASHDLQEPLRKIQAFGERLKERSAGQLGEDEQDYLNRVLNAAGRMQTLLGDLLRYSQVSSQGQPFAPVDLQQVAEGVLSDLEVQLDETGGQVQVGELPVIQADALQMRQLFQNLIGNALKFHKPDVPPLVKVYVNGAQPIEGGPLQAAPDDCIQLVVEDNGIGFDEVDTERIFQPFQRLNGQNKYRGSGIGLAICQKIVERHEGSIQATSRLGEGAKFVVSLPKGRASEPGSHPQTTG